MNEFEQKDFEAARNCADLVKTDADSILAIFDNVDQTMKLLYGEAWQSSGADVSQGRYQQIRKNYEVFYNKEMGMRKLQNYPPYCYLCSITLSGRNEEKVIEAIYRVVDDLNSKLNKEAQILGPITPYISFEQNIHKRSILIKYRNIDLIRDVLKQIISTLKRKSTINITVNIDPYNF